MKEYRVNYTIKGKGIITVYAESKEEAFDEVWGAFGKEECKNEENDWIDQDALFDIEWDEEITQVREVN